MVLILDALFEAVETVVEYAEKGARAVDHGSQAAQHVGNAAQHGTHLVSSSVIVAGEASEVVEHNAHEAKHAIDKTKKKDNKHNQQSEQQQNNIFEAVKDQNGISYLKIASCGIKAKQGKTGPFLKRAKEGLKNFGKQAAKYRKGVQLAAKAVAKEAKQTTAGKVTKSATELGLGLHTSVFAALHGNPIAYVAASQFPSLIKNASKLAGKSVDAVWNTPRNIKGAVKTFKANTKEAGVKHATKQFGKNFRRGLAIQLVQSERFARAVGRDLAKDFCNKPPIGSVICGAKAAANKFKESVKQSAPKEGKDNLAKQGLRIGNATYKATGAFLKTAGKNAVDGYTHHGPLKYIASGAKGLANIFKKQRNKIAVNRKLKNLNRVVSEVRKKHTMKNDALSQQMYNKNKNARG